MDYNNQLYTGKAWKNHISSNFKNGNAKLDAGAGKGGTIFLDYDKMIAYLLEDGRQWHAAELDLTSELLLYEFGNDWMATILRDIPSIGGFNPIII